MDIELEDGTGFDVLDKLQTIPSNIIFITGYDHYALKAIKYAALDYILKPINIDELISAVGKVKIRSIDNRQYTTAIDIVNDKEIDHLWIAGINSHLKIDFHNILYVEADKNYSHLLCEGGKKHISTITIGVLESMLDQQRFFRVHKSFLINIDKIQQIDSGRGGFVLLLEDNKIPIATRRKAELRKLLIRNK